MPLYTTEDAEESLKYFKSVNYGQDLVLSEQLRFKFKDAGHILGSSMVRATVTDARGSDCRILFGGDLGRPGQPILRDPVQAFEIDHLLLESTYGDRLHSNADPSGDLANVINGAIERKGALIIPAFARGRILHHLKRRVPKQETTVLFIGYQGEGTRGRTILSGVESEKIHGKPVDVNAKIEQISGFSAHADYNEILAWLIGFNRPPKKTFLVHGEDDARQALAKKIRAKLGWEVVEPGFGDVAELE